MPKVDREKWLIERSKGIGGSDIAAVLGVSPYSDPIKLYGEKVGLIVRDDMDEDYIEIGNEMEEFVARRFAKKHPEFQVVPAPFIRSRIHPWIQCNIDRLLLNDKGVIVGVLEAKNAGGHQKRYWGETGTDEAPPAFHAQVCWGAVTLKMNPVRVFEEDYELPPTNGKPVQRFVAVLIGGSDYREYPIPADDELDGIFVEAGQRFMANHVIPHIPPQIDGSASSLELVKALYPVGFEPVRVATAKETGLLEQLKPIREAINKLSAQQGQIENLLKESIGTASGIIAPGLGKVSYKNNRDGFKTDFKAVVTVLGKQLPPTMVEAAIADNTKAVAGARPFIPKWEGEKE